MIKKQLQGFVDFIKSKGVLSLAIGFVMGGAVTKLTTSFVGDIVNHIIGLIIGRAGDLKDNYLPIGNAKIMWGNFVNTLLDFLVIALVIYFSLQILGLDKKDDPKDKSKPSAKKTAKK